MDKRQTFVYTCASGKRVEFPLAVMEWCGDPGFGDACVEGIEPGVFDVWVATDSNAKEHATFEVTLR